MLHHYTIPLRAMVFRSRSFNDENSKANETNLCYLMLPTWGQFAANERAVRAVYIQNVTPEQPFNRSLLAIYFEWLYNRGTCICIYKASVPRCLDTLINYNSYIALST